MMKSAKSKAARNRQSIERWTIERLDEETGSLRVETVPMKEEFLDYNMDCLLGTDLRSGVTVGMDYLALWDTVLRKTRSMKVGSLVKLLKLKAKEKKILSENMVFWVVIKAGGKEPLYVYHATQAAREAAKNIYNKVVSSQKGGRI
ncbi:MAG: hypothetical protein V3V95_03980 [Thermodesulfobacteriota bacterium]